MSRTPGHRGKLSLAKASYKTRLDELMGVHGISNKELAEVGRITRNTIQRLRSGKDVHCFTLGTLARIAVSMGLSVADVWPVVLRSPPKGGLVQRKMRQSRLLGRSKKKETATG